MVKVTFRPDEKDIRAIADLTFKYDSRMKRSKRLYFMLGIGCLAGIALCKYYEATVCMAIFIILASFALYMSVTGLRSSFEKAMSRFESTRVERIYSIDDKGITVESDLGRGEYIWDMFLCWGFIRNYIYILVNSRQVILIDKERLDEKELDEVKMLLAGNVRFTTD